MAGGNRPRRTFGLQHPRFSAETDSVLEEAGFKLSVPRDTARADFDEFAADSPLEEAVSSELVSEDEIPC
jgi:hypothetical protein